jgi:enoyl-CoA hydratase/carnithine racemase
VLSRPAQRNALNQDALRNLQQALEDLHQQRSVRAVVLTGDGDCFCAGSDLRMIQSSHHEESPHLAWFADVSQLRELLSTMLRFPKPIISAVNGPALGSGLALVAASDMSLAAPSAQFGLPDARRGLAAGPAIPLLSFRLGASATARLVLRGGLVSADEALRIGLIHEITPFELLWARARQWVDELALTSPAATAMNKRILNETVGEAIFTQLTAATASMAAARTTEDAIEGVAAFLEKRPPKW